MEEVVIEQKASFSVLVVKVVVASAVDAFVLLVVDFGLLDLCGLDLHCLSLVEVGGPLLVAPEVVSRIAFVGFPAASKSERFLVVSGVLVEPVSKVPNISNREYHQVRIPANRSGTDEMKRFPNYPVHEMSMEMERRAGLVLATTCAWEVYRYCPPF